MFLSHSRVNARNFYGKSHLLSLFSIVIKGKGKSILNEAKIRWTVMSIKISSLLLHLFYVWSQLLLWWWGTKALRFKTQINNKNVVAKVDSFSFVHLTIPAFLMRRMSLQSMTIQVKSSYGNKSLISSLLSNLKWIKNHENLCKKKKFFFPFTHIPKGFVPCTEI